MNTTVDVLPVGGKERGLIAGIDLYWGSIGWFANCWGTC